MKKIGCIVVALTAMLFAFPAYAGKVVAKIDLSSQRMYVTVNGVPKYTWSVSTGRSGYRTPTGSYRPQRLEKMWYSTKYDDAPMPHSVFFYGGYAIHGTTAVGSLGRPASHGCVRLHPSNAAKFYALVRQNGMGNAQVVIVR